MATWLVQCQVEYKEGIWYGTHQVPTFYLDPNDVGYGPDNCVEKVATEIVDPLKKAYKVHVSAVLQEAIYNG